MSATESPRSRSHAVPLNDSSLVSIGKYRSFAKGDVLVDQTPGVSDATLILRGVVKVSANISGRNEFLGVHEAGALIGEELAILGLEACSDCGIRFRSVTALTRGRAIIFGAAELRSFLDKNPDVMNGIMQGLGQRLVKAEARCVSNARNHARSRLARVLCELYALDPSGMGGQRTVARGSEIPVYLTQAELASWIGASRESVDKTLQNWRRRGIIATRSGRIAILEPETLANLGQESDLPRPRGT